MPEYEFSLTHVFPYKDIIYDSVIVWENAGQRTPVCWYIYGIFYGIFFFGIISQENNMEIMADILPRLEPVLRNISASTTVQQQQQQQYVCSFWY